MSVFSTLVLALADVDLSTSHRPVRPIYPCKIMHHSTFGASALRKPCISGMLVLRQDLDSLRVRCAA